MIYAPQYDLRKHDVNLALIKYSVYELFEYLTQQVARRVHVYEPSNGKNDDDSQL